MFSLASKSAGYDTNIFLVGTTYSANSTSITLPSGMQPGDVVVITSYSDFESGPSVPTGYTEGQRGSANDVGYMWCYKVMPNPVNTTATGLSQQSYLGHIAMAFRNVDTSNVLDVASPTRATGSGLPNPPAITTSNRACILGIGYLENRILNDIGAPSGYEMAGSGNAGVTGTGATGMVCYVVGDAGTYNPGAFTSADSGSGWVATTCALRQKA